MKSRLVIETKDVQVITGKNEKTCRNMIQLCKDAMGKARHQLVTIKEFCSYFGLNYSEVKESLL